MARRRWQCGAVGGGSHSRRKGDLLPPRSSYRRIYITEANRGPDPFRNLVMANGVSSVRVQNPETLQSCEKRSLVSRFV